MNGEGQIALGERLDRFEALLLRLDERTQEIVIAQASKNQKVESMDFRIDRIEARQTALEDRERRMLFLALAVLLGVVIYVATGEVVLPGA